MFFLFVTLLISGGLIGYWYFFDRSPVEQPSPQYIKPALNFQSIDWDVFNNNLMKIGYVDFFELYPLHMYAQILGVDIYGFEAKYKNEEGFGNLTSDLVERFHENHMLFNVFSNSMVGVNMDLNLMLIDTYNHLEIDDHSFSYHQNNDF